MMDYSEQLRNRESRRFPAPVPRGTYFMDLSGEAFYKDVQSPSRDYGHRLPRELGSIHRHHHSPHALPNSYRHYTPHQPENSPEPDKRRQQYNLAKNPYLNSSPNQKLAIGSPELRRRADRCRKCGGRVENGGCLRCRMVQNTRMQLYGVDSKQASPHTRAYPHRQKYQYPQRYQRPTALGSTGMQGSGQQSSELRQQYRAKFKYSDMLGRSGSADPHYQRQ